ncbi:MAG: ECF transporter S component [Clostridia bacterium]|nr:ECF transporter S component [Clostridia bacterium]
MKNNRTKKLVVLAMLCAVAFAVAALGTPIMPTAPFLKLEFKDAVIVMSGFMFGPLASLAMTVVVAAIELFTVSEAGVIGMMMNILSSGAFACTASTLYRRHRKISGAVLGLVMGVLLMTALMLLWNYTMTPIYMGVDREIVANMLLPVFLPFNILKGFINAAISLALYKPLTTVLRKARLMPPAENKGKIGLWVVTLSVSLIVIAACAVIILVINGKI